jgi:pyruvate dehydrogenase E1 component alpha subunit
VPRTTIDIKEKIEYLSILDEHGHVDSKLEPQLTPEQLKEMYWFMLLSRRADERMLNLQRQGRLGTFPQSSGHEAISIGSAFVLNKQDWHVPAYREQAGCLYRGWPLVQFLLYWGGYEEGARIADGVNDLPICVPVATQLLHATGLGMAMNVRKDKHVVMTYFGDGASSEGDCHEALNFASVFAAPVVFICLNNQYAISVPLERQMKCKTVAQRAIAYGMPGIRVDGNDVLAVYVAAKEAVDRARKGLGPTLIEGLTYRLTPHTTSDDPRRYRSSEEEALWAKRDPLIRLRQYLLAKKSFKEKDFADMDLKATEEINTAIQQFEELASTPKLNEPLRMFDHLYASMPEFLAEQKAELANFLKQAQTVP